MEMNLPIYSQIEQVISQLNSHPIVLLQAPPGAGKSTVLPLELLKASFLKGKKILMLEPRRLAAKSVAARMSDLANEPLGEKIGYQIRFESKTSQHTLIEVVTEGVFTKLIQNDNSIENIGLVIFDEFHERNLQSDLGLALCMQIQQILRPDLKILVMSATLDAEKYSKSLGNAPIILCEGRQHEIEILYTGDFHKKDLDKNVALVVQRAFEEQEGDILVFLPGVAEIKKTMLLLENNLPDAVIYALYGELSIAEQQKVLQVLKNKQRKIVLSTSIAETSLTIEGINTVIDSGLCRIPVFDLKTSLSKLLTLPITKDVAIQRAGRAGRIRAGVCYRMWSQQTHRYLYENKNPEIIAADLSPLLLELYAWGISNPDELHWISKPPEPNIKQARELLQSLDCVAHNKLSEKGKTLAKIPSHPRIANMLLAGFEINQLSLACDIAAIIEEKDPLKTNLCSIDDRLQMLNKWRKKENVYPADKFILERIDKVSLQLSKHRFETSKKTSAMAYQEAIGYLLAHAYPDRVAKKRDAKSLIFKLGNGKTAQIDANDPLQHEEWIAIASMDGREGESKIFLAAALEPKTLVHMQESKKIFDWDYVRKELISKNEITISNIPFKSVNSEACFSEEYLELLANVLSKIGIKALELNKDIESWIVRNNCLCSWNKEEKWKMLDDTDIISLILNHLKENQMVIKKLDDLKKMDFKSIVQSIYSWNELQLLEELVPEEIKVPSGFSIKISYNAYGERPILAVRLQEMFGLLETPFINKGNTPLLLHLLSPGFKPVQVTQDLKSFWKNTYPEVKSELKRRYPKHSWPDDPWSAQAVRGVRKEHRP
jgi:ATP-dependent helicase HrpB